MLTLEEIVQRFTARRTVELPDQTFEPMMEEPPVIVNGLAQMLQHLADQDRRITALEDALKTRMEQHSS